MRRLSPFALLFATGGCAVAEGPTVRVVNADTVTLDRVMVDAGGSAYALGRLLPGTMGQVVPSPAPDSVVVVRHHAGGPFAVAGSFAGASLVEIRLAADSVEAVRVEPEGIPLSGDQPYR